MRPDGGRAGGAGRVDRRRNDGNHKAVAGSERGLATGEPMVLTKKAIEESELPRLTDEALLSSSLEGNRVAFDLLVDRYYDRLYGYLLRFLKDPEMAMDLLQETFLRVWKKRRDFKHIASFSTWIYTIAGNLARSEWRRRKRWRMLRLGAPGGDEDGPELELPDPGGRPDRKAEDRMAVEALTEAVTRLPERYREVIILRDMQGMSYEEIAGIVQVPVGTVKSRLNRGRLLLQEKLGDWYEHS
jgi:RNA polymerase sigma-70 factor (ECF subfamily)